MKRQSPEMKLLEAIYGPPRDLKTNPYTKAEIKEHKQAAAMGLKWIEEEQKRREAIAQKPRNVAARARRAALRATKVPTTLTTTICPTCHGTGKVVKHD